ncbi:MAG TPA: zinc-ribbon domain-containing protein [Nitrososphaerales archaeon]|nr:zinc-ribbon domain-containing protein [Nitrososphaerales archaeon]
MLAGIITSLLSLLFMNVTQIPTLPNNVQSLPPDQLLSLAGKVFTAIGFIYVSYFASWFVLYFSCGVAIRKMGQRVRQEAAVPEAETQNSARPSTLQRLNYASLAVTTFIAVLLVWLGLILVIVGSIILGTLLYYSLCASALGNKSAGSAIGQSRQLVSGRWIKTLAINIVMIFIAYVGSDVVGTIASLVVPSDLSGVVSNVVGSFFLALLFPLVASSMIVCYYSALSTARQAGAISPPPPPSTSYPQTQPRSPYDSMKPEPMWPSPPRPATPPPPPPSGTSPRFCQKCGSGVSEDERFCHNCGTKL